MSAKTPFRPGSGPAPTTPRRPPGRRRGLRAALLGLAALVVLAAAAHTALWFWGAGRLEAGFAAWAAARRAEGWRVAHGPAARTGWPFGVALHLPDLRLDDGAAAGSGGDGWQAEAVTLRLLPARPDRLHLEASGPQRLRLGGTEIPMRAEALRASLPLAPTPPGALPAGAWLAAAALRLDLPAGPVDLARLRVELAQPPPGAPPTAATASLNATADAVTLPPVPAGDAATAALARRFGQRLEALRVELALTGPMPPPFGPPAARAARWRDAGGAVELRAFSLRWGPAAATASATLALDAAMQPAGAGTLRLAGAGAVLDAATEAGLVPPRSAGAARLALQMMQRRPHDGGPPLLEVPLTLEERTLALARFPLARLPVLAW